MLSEETIRGLREGDRKSFEEVFNHFYNYLFYFSKRYLKEKEDCEDVIIEVFTIVWLKRNTFETYTMLKAFISIITKNRCISIIRDNNSTFDRYLSFIEDQQKEESIDSTQNYISNKDKANLLGEAIETLPNRCGQIIRMHFMYGLGVTEISVLLGITQNNVSTQKKRGLQILRTKLQPMKDAV